MELYGHTVDGDWFRQRLLGVLALISAAFFVLIVRLYYLQVINGEMYFRLSENNCIRRQPVHPGRGLIFDRHGVLLVDNRPSYDLMIIPGNARPLDETLARLAPVVGRPARELRAIIDRRGVRAYQPVLLLRDIDRDLLAAVEARQYDFPGVYIDVSLKRHYLHNESAVHVIGYLGEISAEELKSERYRGNRPGDYIGKYGIEKRYESTLRGKSGERLVEVDAKGRVVNVLKTVHAEAGADIQLTIDIALQRKAEEMLAGRAGAVVAMDPESGEILAMASGPAFNPNRFVDGLTQAQWSLLTSNPARPLENKAIQGTYPPASIYKVITTLAGLEEGLIDGRTAVFCRGTYRFGDRDFRCWKRTGHGDMNIVRALAESCDVYFYQAGLKIGVDRLAWYARACGLGSRTGVPLDNEARGLVPTANWKRQNIGEPWYRGETLSVAIGQGYNLATPMQVAVLTAAVANGGKRLRPVIVKSDRTRVMGKIPLQPETLELIRRGLWEVVHTPGGTAPGIRIANMDIFGKTGTAQVVSRIVNGDEDREDIPHHHRSHGWFMAYAPGGRPAIALAVIIEHGESGSGAAGPVARELIRMYLAPDDASGSGGRSDS